MSLWGAGGSQVPWHRETSGAGLLVGAGPSFLVLPGHPTRHLSVGQGSGRAEGKESTSPHSLLLVGVLVSLPVSAAGLACCQDSYSERGGQECVSLLPGLLGWGWEMLGLGLSLL